MKEVELLQEINNKRKTKRANTNKFNITFINKNTSNSFRSLGLILFNMPYNAWSQHLPNSGNPGKLNFRNTLPLLIYHAFYRDLYNKSYLILYWNLLFICFDMHFMAQCFYHFLCRFLNIYFLLVDCMAFYKISQISFLIRLHRKIFE